MLMNSKTAIAASLLWMTACGGGAEDGRNPMGSQAMITSQDYQALYVASANEGVVARLDAASMQVQRLAVNGEPTRLARVGDRLFVTLRTERAIQELFDGNGQLTTGRKITVGAEPVGLVATEDGTRLYVAVSMTDEVKELDAQTLEVLRVWSLKGEPRWLALHPSNHSLYVAGSAKDSLHWINLKTGAASQVTVPLQTGFSEPNFEQVELTGRITGDPAASPDGRFLAVPILLVDNTTPLTEPDPEDSEPPAPSSGYGSRMHPVVGLIAVDGSGKPKEGIFANIQATGVRSAGYLASVTFTPDSKYMVATIEGGATALVIETESSSGDILDFENPAPGIPTPDGFTIRNVTAVQTPAGPRSVAFTSDQEAFVYGFLDRRVARLDMDAALGLHTGGGGPSAPFDGSGALVTDGEVEIAASTLTADLAEGQRLFYSTNDSRVSRPGSGVSCATCHFDGRADGLTWIFERGPRQTPSLAGLVSAREPVRWQADKATVAIDAMSTSQGLMGGDGLLASDADRIALFIDSTRAVDLPLKGSDDPRIARGRDLFNREDVGCGGCHSGALFTDKQQYTMFGFEGVKTPSLLGVAATPPYLHDGTAPTLRAVLDAARGGAMGNTGGLTEAELEDLEAYLRSI